MKALSVTLSLLALSALATKFEAYEHTLLGDFGFSRACGGSCAVAHLLGKSSTGATTLLLENGLQLKYGSITGMAGDIFGVPSLPISSAESDDEALVRFEAAFTTINSEGAKATVTRVSKIFDKEGEAVDKYLRQGAATSRGYADLAGLIHKHDIELHLATATTYLKLASMNFDHFGHDAVRAYKAAHVSALQTAKKAFDAKAAGASDTEYGRLVNQALARNAWADHYLTDLFASGHLRTPRRSLHFGCGNAGLLERFVSATAGDKYSKYMHDEDNEVGLIMQNRAGDKPWIAFGDTRLLHHMGFVKDASDMLIEGNMNVIMAIRAVKESAQDVLDMITKGTVIMANGEAYAPGTKHDDLDFVALETAPDVRLTRKLNVATRPPLYLLETEGEQDKVMVRKNGAYQPLAGWSCSPGYVATPDTTENYLSSPDVAKSLLEQLDDIDHLQPLVTDDKATDGSTTETTTMGKAIKANDIGSITELRAQIGKQHIQELNAVLRSDDVTTADASRKRDTMKLVAAARRRRLAAKTASAEQGGLGPAEMPDVNVDTTAPPSAASPTPAQAESDARAYFSEKAAEAQAAEAGADSAAAAKHVPAAGADAAEDDLAKSLTAEMGRPRRA